MGGQGLNLGLADAMNLGWKLAAVAAAKAPPALLDTYEMERAPVGRAVIDDTLAQTALITVPGREGQALRAMMTRALTEDRALNSRLAVAASGIAVAYPPGDGAHPLVGRRVPNLALEDGSDVFRLLERGRFCIIGISPAAIADSLGAWALADLSVSAGGFAAPPSPWAGLSAALIRPDGHLAWAADRDPDDRDPDDGEPAERDTAERDTAERDTAGRRAGAAGSALLRWLPGIASSRRHEAGH
jgi:hypothetical protein